MRKSERIEVVSKAVKNQELCRVGYRFNESLKYMFPLMTSEKLFLASRECDFDFGGYHIGKFSDIHIVDTRKNGDKLFEIIKAEGLSKYLTSPMLM